MGGVQPWPLNSDLALRVGGLEDGLKVQKPLGPAVEHAGGVVGCRVLDWLRVSRTRSPGWEEAPACRTLLSRVGDWDGGYVPGQLGDLGCAGGKMSVAIPGERSCLGQGETRAGNGPGKGEPMEGVLRVNGGK